MADPRRGTTVRMPRLARLMALFSLPFLILTSASADAVEYPNGSSTMVVVAPLYLAKKVEPRDQASRKVLLLVLTPGYCLGEPKPVIDRLKVVERPAIDSGQTKRSIITAFVRYPGPPVSGAFCAGVGYAIHKEVTLRRPVADLGIFDGSYSPPRPVRLT